MVRSKLRFDIINIATDNLSREQTTGFLEKQMLSRRKFKVHFMVITDRLINQWEDWTLADLIVDHVVQLFCCCGWFMDREPS
jgi:hypothetical protein